MLPKVRHKNAILGKLSYMLSMRAAALLPPILHIAMHLCTSLGQPSSKWGALTPSLWQYLPYLLNIIFFSCHRAYHKVNTYAIDYIQLYSCRRKIQLFHSILYYSILFYSILFYSILFYSILFYSILFYSIIFFWLLLVTWLNVWFWRRE